MKPPKLKLTSVSAAVTYRFDPAPEDKENRDFHACPVVTQRSHR